MPELTKTMKLHLRTNDEIDRLFSEFTERYASACNFISNYVFENGFILNFMQLQEQLYQTVRSEYGLKAQMTISSFKTVTARYKTVKEQLAKKPFCCRDETGKTWTSFRTLEWLQKPVQFFRPQADLVRNRDYSFLKDGSMLSINTLEKRVKVEFDVPECFKEYFDPDSGWTFGTGKLVRLKKEWYLHIPVTRIIEEEMDVFSPKHVVGIDRGLRFIMTAYDEKGKTRFFSGKDVVRKRERFNRTRAELQSKGTKSAKRALKRLSEKENRWMTDINHQLSKALTDYYGPGTLFVMEDLEDVSFNDNNFHSRKQTNELRSWTFYQLEQFLTYKAQENGSMVIKVSPDYTSQRCPKCGRIHKENRKHGRHEYVCDCCGYRSNDDRIGAMNIYVLGTMYVSGNSSPKFGKRKAD